MLPSIEGSKAAFSCEQFYATLSATLDLTLWTMCSTREKFLGISIVSVVVIFFLTRCDGWTGQLRMSACSQQQLGCHVPLTCTTSLRPLTQLRCSVGTVLFLALGISVAGVALHGICRVPDDLFTDEAEVSWRTPATAAAHDGQALAGYPAVLVGW